MVFFPNLGGLKKVHALPPVVVPPQWLPVFLASAPASPPPSPSPSPTMTDLTAASLPAGFSVAHFASARAPRGMLIVESGDLLVVSTFEPVVLVREPDRKLWLRSPVARERGLNKEGTDCV